MIAHEVRNPLMIIKAALRNLRRPGMGERDLREAAGDIDQEVTRLNRIVGDVLDFARPVRLDCAPTDLNALCREAAERRHRRRREPPEWKLSLDPALAPVVTDGERLRTVLVNILTNAREAVQRARAAAGRRGPTSSCAPSALADGRAAIEVRGPRRRHRSGRPAARVRALLHDQAHRARASAWPSPRTSWTRSAAP